MKLLWLVEQMSARLESAGVCYGHGTSNAFDEAAWLVLWRIGLPLDALHRQAERELRAGELEAVADLIEQRIGSRKPAAYLTGEAWLQGVPFTVDERVIVPRSLIAEVLVDGTLDPWFSPVTPGTGFSTGMRNSGSSPTCSRVLDLCTGNGSLAVLAAMAWPEVSVDAAELSAQALAVARLNVDRHGLTGRVTLLQGDGLAALAGRRYELVLCNPPYVNSHSMAALPAEYRAEPAMALAGGSDGMDFIRGLLSDVADHLSHDGLLVLEIGHERAHFEAAFPGFEVVWLATSAGDDQVLLVTRSALVASAAVVTCCHGHRSRPKPQP